MVDIDFVGQLVDSMAEAVEKLEQAKVKGDVNVLNKLKVFIFDLHEKLDSALDSLEINGGEYNVR